MTDDSLQDAGGMSLPRALVEAMARGNMQASSNLDTAALLDDRELLRWATDSGGYFFGPQVAAYSDGEYKPCAAFHPDADDLPTCGKCGFTPPGHTYVADIYR